MPGSHSCSQDKLDPAARGSFSSGSLLTAQEGTRDWSKQRQLFQSGRLCTPIIRLSLSEGAVWDLFDHRENLGKMRLSSLLLSSRPSGPLRDMQATHLANTSWPQSSMPNRSSSVFKHHNSPEEDIWVKDLRSKPSTRPACDWPVTAS